MMRARRRAQAGNRALPHVAGCTQGRQIGLDRLHGGGIGFHKAGAAGTAGQRLDAKRAGAGKQIEHIQPLEAAEPAGEHGENRLAGAVAGRAGGRAGRGLQRPAPPAARNDAHQRGSGRAALSIDLSRATSASGISSAMRGGRSSRPIGP